MLPTVYGSGNMSGSSSVASGSSVRGSRQSSIDSDFTLSTNEGGSSTGGLVQNRLTTGSPVVTSAASTPSTASPPSTASTTSVTISPTPVVNMYASGRSSSAHPQPVVSAAICRASSAVPAPVPAQSMPRVQSHQSNSGGHPAVTVTATAPRPLPVVVAATVNPNVGGSSCAAAAPLRLKLSGADLCWTCKVNPVKVRSCGWC
jgi:hypothetical protein